MGQNENVFAVSEPLTLYVTFKSWTLHWTEPVSASPALRPARGPSSGWPRAVSSGRLGRSAFVPFRSNAPALRGPLPSDIPTAIVCHVAACQEKGPGPCARVPRGGWMTSASSLQREGLGLGACFPGFDELR